MIVRAHDDGWLLITQPAHAALAGRIMREWQEPALRQSIRRDTILLAVAGHDNGWADTDAAPVLDASGRVLDFVALPAAMRQEVWPRGVDRLARVPYAAALVAQHAVHVYGRFRGDPAWTAFFAGMERARDEELRHAAPATIDDLLADYQFVRTGDLMSLAFCNNWRDPQQDGFGRTIHYDGSRMTVSPDPFEGRTLEIQITGRYLESIMFPTAAAAKEALDGAPLKTIGAVVAGV